MRATYGQELKAKSLLELQSIDSYVPMEWRVVVTNRAKSEKRVRQLRPLMNNYIFVHATAAELFKAKEGVNFLRYIMVRGGTEKLVVPDEQMENFIKVSSQQSADLNYFTPDEVNLTKGQRIRIIGGAFDGVEGRYIKFEGRRNRHLVVEIDGVIAVSVSIKPEFVEVISEE